MKNKYEIPENYRKTLKKIFLLLSSGYHNIKRILIFGSDYGVKNSKISKMLVIVGTFKVVPKEFDSLFSIHFYQFGTYFSVFFMPNRLRKTYISIFIILKKN